MTKSVSRHHATGLDHSEAHERATAQEWSAPCCWKP